MEFLIFIVLAFGLRTAFGDLSLAIEHNVKGVKGQSLVIPCKYTPSDQYTENEVKWYKDETLIFQRLNSEDHVMLANLRNRVAVSKSPLGDVSLTIYKLKPVDTGDYKCKVKWKSLQGTNTIVTKEDTSAVTLLKEFQATTKPKVKITTENKSSFMTIFPATAKPKVKITTEFKPGFMTKFSATTKPKVKITTAFKSSLMTTFGDLSLAIEHNVKGVKGQPLVIPCKYTPSDQYTEYEVLWYKGNALIIYRMDSEDHIMLANLRNRVAISKSPLGDVSLTIYKLAPIDTGDYKCTVKWKSLHNWNKIVTEEETSAVTLLKESPATEKPKVKITTDNKPDLVTDKFSTKNNAKIINTNAKEPTLMFHTTAEPSTSHNRVTEYTGSGVPLHIVLILGLVCLLSMITIMIILIMRRNRKSDSDVGILTMSQLADNLAPTTINSCQPCANQVSRASNDYEPFKDQSEYQAMFSMPDNEYELLLTERENNLDKTKMYLA
uniref:Ig-like domain-containing protein n=1 Tax=Leptobrachium leishanense TaxID=445787 RepID=A0A8C5Q7T7_9ANUR